MIFVILTYEYSLMIVVLSPNSLFLRRNNVIRVVATDKEAWISLRVYPPSLFSPVAGPRISLNSMQILVSCCCR